MTIKVLYSLTDYCQIDVEELSMNEQENPLKHNVSGLIKFLVWSLSKISQSLIKLTAPVKKTSEMHKNLSKSKLLSGGVKNRFLSIFTKKTSKTIGNLATVTGDDKLTEYLSPTTKSDEDQMYESIIYSGKDELVDKLLDLLQWSLTRKDPSARVGGNEGMILSRCAFVCMLALNRHKGSTNYATFVSMITQLETSIELVEGDSQNKINKELMEELKQLDDVDSIFESWKMASKMRIWLQEQRKNIANKVKSNLGNN